MSNVAIVYHSGLTLAVQHGMVWVGLAQRWHEEPQKLAV